MDIYDQHSFKQSAPSFATLTNMPSKGFRRLRRLTRYKNIMLKTLTSFS